MTEQRPGLIRRIDDTGIPLLLARLAVGGMFAYLAVNKLMDPVEFLKQTRAYHILPESFPLLLNMTAIVVPWLELICAVALLLGVCVRGAAATVLGMLLFFAPLLLMRAYGLYVDPVQAGQYATFCDVKFDCGCGTGEVYICAKMAENTALKIGALIGLLSSSRRWCLATVIARLRTPLPTAAAERA